MTTEQKALAKGPAMADRIHRVVIGLAWLAAMIFFLYSGELE